MSAAADAPSDRFRLASAFRRVLGLAGGDDAPLRRSKLVAFRRFVLLHGATRSWLWLAADGSPAVQGLWLSAAALTLCAGLSFFRRTEPLAPRLALPVLLLQLAQTLPLTHNHFFVELYAVSLLCVLGGGRDDDEVLALQALQWLAVLVLFHAGLQKVLYGLYFRGEFLSFMVGQGERFAAVFRPLLSEAEVGRLQGYDALRTGAGPYRVSSLPFVLVSNAVYVAEMVLAPLLLLHRTRGLAAAAALALILGIQLGAREVGFAVLFVNLLLLFPRRDWIRLALPGFVLLDAVAIAAAFGWIPGADIVQGINP